MINIKNIAKNEMEKFLSEKYFKVMIIFIILWIILLLNMYLFMGGIYDIMSETLLNENIPQQNAEKIFNALDEAKATSVFVSQLTGLKFSAIVVQETLYTGITGFIAVLFTLFAVHIFREDSESGNMKYTMITGASYNEILLGKWLFMVCYILIFTILFVIASFVLGQMYFGGEILSKFLLTNIANAIVGIFPLTAICSIIFLLSQTRISLNKLKKIAIILPICLTFIPRKIMIFMPINFSVISFSVENSSIISTKTLCIAINIIYIIVFSTLGIIYRKKEFYK